MRRNMNLGEGKSIAPNPCIQQRLGVPCCPASAFCLLPSAFDRGQRPLRALLLVFCLPVMAPAVDYWQESVPDLPAAWERKAAVTIVSRLEASRTTALGRHRGRITAEDGSHVQISLGASQGVKPGDILEVTCLRTSTTDQLWYCGLDHAATLCLASVEPDRSIARIVEKRVEGPLDDRRYRIGYFRKQRVPVSVAAESVGPFSSPQRRVILARLVPAVEDRLEQSPCFSLVRRQVPSSSSGQPARGAVLIDKHEYAYVNLTRFDGVEPGELLGVTLFSIRPGTDGIDHGGFSRVALLRVMRADPYGSLCAIQDRQFDGRLDDRGARVYVQRLNSNPPDGDQPPPQDRKRQVGNGTVHLAAYVPGDSERPSQERSFDDPGPAVGLSPPFDERIWTYTIHLDLDGSPTGGPDMITAELVQAEGQGPTVTARMVLDPGSRPRGDNRPSRALTTRAANSPANRAAIHCGYPRKRSR